MTERHPIARHYLDPDLVAELEEAGVFTEQQISAICLIFLRVLHKVEGDRKSLNSGRTP
jgi:hypothetical protein